jgi:hypothetical protein
LVKVAVGAVVLVVGEVAEVTEVVMVAVEVNRAVETDLLIPWPAEISYREDARAPVASLSTRLLFNSTRQ